MKLPHPCLALLLLPVLAAGAVAADAPDAERETVVRVVQDFFDALQTKDAARLLGTCQPGAQFTSVRPGADGGATVRQRSVEADAAQIASAKESWLERMWSPTVHIAGRIAVVWTRYDFHRDGRMSHNGTDCFTLLRTSAGWKIVNAAYTVEPSDQTQHAAGPPPDSLRLTRPLAPGSR